MLRQPDTVGPPSSPALGDRFHLWVDFIRDVSILLVILGHVSAVPMIHTRVTSPDWMVGNVYNVIARACVPMIFMISGALLLPKQESILDFYRKRFQRVFIPFVFWSVLYLLIAKSIPFDSVPSAFLSIVRDLVTRPAEYHLWFMYDLFWIYLATPILRVFVASAKREHLWYFMALWFIFVPLRSALEYRAGFEFIAGPSFPVGFLGYFVLGYILASTTVTTRQVWGAVVVYLFAAVYTILSTQTASLLAKGMDGYHQTLTNWNIVALSISGFVLLKTLGEWIGSRGDSKLRNGIHRLAPFTFGIYLIHVFVLRFLNRPFLLTFNGFIKLPPRFSFSPLMEPTVVVIPALTLTVFLISWLVIFLLRKIPCLRIIT